MASLKQIITEEHIDAIVVGVPLHHEASQEQKKATEEFIALLRVSIDHPIEMEDESFTSRQAGRHIQEGGPATKDDHSVAAMLILQSFLDRRTQ
jgi:RNase H-fold protein (predicted Holliday junction resolvase)